MRVCQNCGKANQPIRKFCIRCGQKLYTATVSNSETAEEPKHDEEDVSLDNAQNQEGQQEERIPHEEEDEKFVRPSEIPKDRVRSSASTKRMTEFEKAQLAFKRAETAGIEEAPSGIVESRMLRPSEVHQLLGGPSEMEGSAGSTGSTSGSSPHEPEVGVGAPEPDELEEQILGSHSAYVKKEKMDEPEVDLTATMMEEAELPPEVSSDFASSKYAEGDSQAPSVKAETVEEDAEGMTWDAEVEEEAPIAKQDQEPRSSLMANMTTCPHCGEAINVDTFEYAPEVYSAMGEARLKQARFFLVQGKYDRARQVVRIAHALMKKAGDEEGLNSVKKLIDSLARKN